MPLRPPRNGTSNVPKKLGPNGGASPRGANVEMRLRAGPRLDADTRASPVARMRPSWPCDSSSRQMNGDSETSGARIRIRAPGTRGVSKPSALHRRKRQRAPHCASARGTRSTSSRSERGEAMARRYGRIGGDDAGRGGGRWGGGGGGRGVLVL
ncbi:unnamed protein product [Chondrus crispus]|uniref:Uncharacterized protein n=1 Tax=Chondrus crispus TaxID=2769 RepID=R7QDF5_CHOCR|nr:unnamed protein product [Chondrus crispus]CDF36532.1 unnamed protein product [Chondrus crispus]|eukprot:XP_005716351.1 unnamed protein product [Chondrus crispus]